MELKRAVVSVIGKDQVGIIARVTTVLSNNDVNILDISQTIMQGFFTMTMIVDVSKKEYLEQLQKELAQVGDEIGVQIHLQLDEIFKSMHRI